MNSKSLISLILLISISTLAINAEMKPISKEQAMQLLAQYQEQKQPNVTYLNQAKIPTLLVFTTNWCGYCKQLRPHLDRISKEYKNKIFVKEVNIESIQGKALAKTNKIGGNGVPHIQIYGGDGKLLRNRMGYQSYESLKTEVELFI